MSDNEYNRWKRSTEKKKKKKKKDRTEQGRTEAIVKGWELNDFVVI